MNQNLTSIRLQRGIPQLLGLGAAVGLCLLLLCAGPGAARASAAFGLVPDSVDATVLDQAGNFAPQAGAHPFSVTTKFKLNTEPGTFGEDVGLPVSSEANLRNVTVEAPAGLIGNPTATPRCTLEEFMGPEALISGCPDSTQVGVAYTDFNLFGMHVPEVPSAIYNLEPQPGQPALFAFKAVVTPVFAVPTIRTDGDYGIDFNVINIDQTVTVTGNKFSFWGVPASPAHDGERGEPVFGLCGGDHSDPPPCESNEPPKPFLTNPVDCEHGPFLINTEVESWLGHRDSDSVLTHDNKGNPAGVERCDRVPFEPTIDSEPSTALAETPSGLRFEMRIPDTGLNNPDGLSQSLLKKAVVTLPEGFTLNPSAGEGLGVCTPADYAREKVTTKPGEGCPNGSRLGSVRIESPLLEAGEFAEGALYLAQPDLPATPAAGAENPFDSLLALYLVARVPERGVVIKSAGKVDLDPSTGQITTTFDDLPQLPFSSFAMSFREGGRAPLVSSPSCGPQKTVAALSSYSAPSEPVIVESTAFITQGVGGGPCPKAGLPPFNPGLIAGSVNNAAGAHSPFNVRLTRNDGEQEITHFSIKLPPGLSAKLAGVPFCPDSAIAQAMSRERLGGGGEEEVNPSCPAASQIGRTLVGAGAGSVLTYAPGNVYLAGPYNGSALSIVAITNGVVGPFDIGTVVVREAIEINPETAEVFIDATGSDPIPHIVHGVTTHIRDIRVYVDRPQFALNPTSCEPTSTASTVLGSGLDFASEADDNPITVSTRFQAADCAALGFKPHLKLSLRGGTKRSQTPALKAVLTARGGDANISGAEVILPRSEFLEQAHIRTVCTRVQFSAGAGNGAGCPAGSIYGRARAVTPLLDEALEGPVFLRANGGERKLPDLVAALRSGKIDINLVGYIDSVTEKNARGETFSRIRNRFEVVPDAPVTRFVLEMQGGKKGLLVNSTDICKSRNRASVEFEAHNGRVRRFAPLVRPGCGDGRASNAKGIR